MAAQVFVTRGFSKYQQKLTLQSFNCSLNAYFDYEWQPNLSRRFQIKDRYIYLCKGIMKDFKERIQRLLLCYLDIIRKILQAPAVKH